MINSNMNALFKKLIRDYNYLSETLEDVKEISSVAEGEFRNALLETDPDAVEALKPKTQQINIQDAEVINDVMVENHNDVKFKKLFRKIAVKCHPDKIKNASESEIIFLKKMYHELNIANDTHDWGMLLKIAMELNIEFDDLSESEIENINKNIEILQNEISRYEKSMAYSWYTKNDENSKREYLAICAKIFKKSLED